MRENLKQIKQDYLRMLDDLTNSITGRQENQIHQYLERRTLLLPGQTGIQGTSHHGPYSNIIFSKFPLSGSFRRFPDFLFVTKTSAQATVVFIEIEDPSKKIFTGNDDFTSEFNHAFQQLQDWKIWFETDSNKSLLRQWLAEAIKHHMMSTLPMKAEYILIYGRRSEFEGHANKIRRLSEKSTYPYSVMSFDRLEPHPYFAGNITVRKDDNGYYAVEVSEEYEYDLLDYSYHKHIRNKEVAVSLNIYKNLTDKEQIIERIKLFEKMTDKEVRDYFYKMGSTS